MSKGLKKTDYDLVSIGQRMKLIRARLRKTQSAMAADMGISLSHYSKLEVGIGGMSHGLLYTFCRLFEINQDWFVYGIGNEPEPTDPDKTDTPKVIPKAKDEIKYYASIDDSHLNKILEIATNDKINCLADQYAETMGITKQQALFGIVREQLRRLDDEERKRREAQIAEILAAEEKLNK